MIAIEVGYNDLGSNVVIAAHIVPDWTAAQAAADEDFAGIDAVRDSDWTQGPHRAAQQPGQVALVFKLRGRAPEGAVLDLAQVEAIGYDLKILERVS